ncbi:MAG: hypothetical protein KDA60_04580, partial [Planctomycetales bacterium]|nr:hypothetical protein [Planctomycetales bacterium]
RIMLEKIARATVAKAARFDAQELAAEHEDYAKKVVKILRSMERKPRNEMLASVEGKDKETVARIREMMYSIDDVGTLDDRTIQKLLAEVDTDTLSKVLKNADESIADRVLSNLSRRARAGLIEEMDLLSHVGEDERRMAERKIVQVLIELDQRGELTTLA